MPPQLDPFDHNNNQHPLSYDGLPASAQEQFDPDASTQIVNSNGSISKTSRAPPPNKGIDSLEGLRNLPELRELPWKEGKELAAEQIAKQCTRVQSRGAFL